MAKLKDELKAFKTAKSMEDKKNDSMVSQLGRQNEILTQDSTAARQEIQDLRAQEKTLNQQIGTQADLIEALKKQVRDTEAEN